MLIDILINLRKSSGRTVDNSNRVCENSRKFVYEYLIHATNEHVPWQKIDLFI